MVLVAHFSFVFFDPNRLKIIFFCTPLSKENTKLPTSYFLADNQSIIIDILENPGSETILLLKKTGSTRFL